MMYNEVLIEKIRPNPVSLQNLKDKIVLRMIFIMGIPI